MLNRLFDTKKPILEQLYDYAYGNDGRIPDYFFPQCLSENNRLDEEDAIMDEMFSTDEYQFSRYIAGFTVVLKY